ncbi:hypothetical protein [Roseivirga sp.]|uniref:hypothetical protein n=1 Tax=Roseivirga sp. TaxID=1964215 RepID=UPI003B8CA84D
MEPNEEPIENSSSKNLLNLQDYCIQQRYHGYSLYDSHNSVIPFEKFGHRISFLTNQVVKRSPINLRKILGVKKGVNPKGMGLLLHSYSLIIQHDLPQVDGLLKASEEIFEWLYENYSKGYSGKCWGYNYDWPRSDGSMFHAYKPSVVVTAFIARGLIAYYKVTAEPRVKELIKSACEFVKNDIHCTIKEGERCYSYTPVQRDLVVNANLLAAELFAYDDFLSNQRKYLKEVKEVLAYTLSTQNSDGSWYYSHSPVTGAPKKQIDFHQGYVVDSIDILIDIYKLENPTYSESIKKGVRYYAEKQFDKTGFCYWRFPKVWPIDIHNQSQGIITMSRFMNLNKGYLPFANTIFKWTLANMKAPAGHFYYQKYPWFTNKTNYFRWNQCWMLLAQVKLMIAMNKEQ